MRLVAEARRKSSGGQLRALSANIGALLASNVVNRATSFIVYALVAGFRGARELGQLALAMSLFFLFNRLVLLGLETLTTREIAKHPRQTGRYLGTASVTVTLSSLAALPAVWGLATLMDYSPSTVRVIVFLFLGMAPFAFGQLTEATFVAWERSRYVAASNAPVWIAQTVAAYLLLESGRGVDAVALSIAGAYAAIAIVHLLLVVRALGVRIRIDIPFVPSLLRSAAPFLGIQGLNAVRSNVNIIVISRFSGETAVGLFAAANQLLTPLHLVFHATGMGAFPAMVRQFQAQTARLRALAVRLSEFTLALAIPAATGLAILAQPILLLIFRNAEFEGSVGVLRILAWTTVHMAMTAVLGQVLWATHREGVALRIAIANTVALVAASVILTWRFDIEGAAAASLLVGTAYVLQHYAPLRRLVPGSELWKAAWKPLGASTVMAGYLLISSGLALWTRIGGGVLVYGAALFAAYAIAAGGYGRLVQNIRSARVEAR